MIAEITFIAVQALNNHIRGGMFRPKVPNGAWYDSTQLWRVVSAIIFFFSCTFLLSLHWFPAFLLTFGWGLFIIYGWGAWFDMGLLPPQLDRGGFLRPIYVWLSDRLDQVTVDSIMMTVRGLLSGAMFIAIACITGKIAVLLLTVPFAVFWASMYYIDRRLIVTKNWAEYMSGALVGLFILIGLWVM